MEATLLSLWNTLVSWFMMPGAAMIRSLAGTAWGKEWGVPANPDWIIVMGVSLVFWCLLLSLLSAADDQVRGFLNRNNRHKGE